MEGDYERHHLTRMQVSRSPARFYRGCFGKTPKKHRSESASHATAKSAPVCLTACVVSSRFSGLNGSGRFAGIWENVPSGSVNNRSHICIGVPDNRRSAICPASPLFALMTIRFLDNWFKFTNERRCVRYASRNGAD